MIHGRVLLTLVVSLVLVSCGGGASSDGGGGGTPAPLTGAFIDSPVQGLPYTTRPSGLSGKTGPNGEFQYRPGDFVVFFGNTVLSIEAPGQPVISPFDLFKRTSVPDVRHEWPVNMARYLLGLDITPGTDVITLPTTLPPLPLTTCFSCPNFDAEATAAGIPLVAEADAIAHLKKQFAIWGSWATASSPGELQVFTFLPNGTYLLAHDDNPAILGGNDGMERGTYRWNADTNAFTYTVAVNTDGTGGLSNAGAPPYSFVIDGSGNSAVLRLGPNISDAIQLTRVNDAGRPIVGAWKLQVPFDTDFSAVITFLSDGTFTVASDAIDAAPAGLERGTYVFTAATGNLTLITTVDTNGAFGFNDSPTLPVSSIEQLELQSSLTPDLDFMRLSDGAGIILFDRIKVP